MRGVRLATASAMLGLAVGIAPGASAISFASPVAHAGQPTGGAGHATVPLSCESLGAVTAPGAVCTFQIFLVINSSLVKGAPVGLGMNGGPDGVGKVTVTVRVGTSKAAAVPVNSLGARLLKADHRFKATVLVDDIQGPHAATQIRQGMVTLTQG